MAILSTLITALLAASAVVAGPIAGTAPTATTAAAGSDDVVPTVNGLAFETGSPARQCRFDGVLHPFWRGEPSPGMPHPYMPNNAIEKFEQMWGILHKYNLENENRGDAKVHIYTNLLATLADTC